MKRAIFMCLLSFVGVALCFSPTLAAEAKKIVFASEIVDVIGPSNKMVGPCRVEESSLPRRRLPVMAR